MFKKSASIFFVITFLLYSMPAVAAKSNVKTISGTVTGINGSQILFKTTSAARYAAEIGSAVLARKYGAPMNQSEIVVGDKVEVRGFVWPDNSISTAYLRNLSLYAHNSTFTGKVVSIDPASSSFTIESKPYGDQVVRTNNLTVFKKNSSASTFHDVELGMGATVKSIWERSNNIISATQVTGTVRLLNIDITGQIMATNSTSFTVLANNVLYGVDASKAKIENKSGKTVSINQYRAGQTLRVQGKRLAEGVAVTASVVKNLSLTK